MNNRYVQLLPLIPALKATNITSLSSVQTLKLQQGTRIVRIVTLSQIVYMRRSGGVSGIANCDQVLPPGSVLDFTVAAGTTLSFIEDVPSARVLVTEHSADPV